MAKIKIGLIILFSIIFTGSIFAGAVKANSYFAIDNFDNLNNIKDDIQAKLDALKGKFVQDEIIVKFRGDQRPFRVIKVPEGKIGDMITEYLKRADVEYAEPNYIAYALMTPNDPYYKYQWNFDNPVYGGIQMEKAWDITTGNSSVVVAVVDSGIAYENYGSYCQAPDLAQACFVPGYDFINNDSHPNDDNSHGTHVAGTIAQSTNNSLGVAGIAYNTCLMPVKVLNSAGSGSYAAVANGIRFAADNGAKIINLSLGGSASDNTLKDAVKYAYEKGVTVIAACGNDNTSSCSYPAAYDDYVIAVGATQYDETKAPYSSYGPSLDIVAPGGNTTVDQNGDGYGDGILQQTFSSSRQTCSFSYYFFQGTSMAAPHVSGVSALLIANGNATNPADIRAALQETAKDKGAPGRDNTYGYGIVDAYKSLQWRPAGPVCSSDTDCNDSNECTNDVCLNPGTPNAYCSHSNVADNTACTGGVCCSGKCAAPACLADANCNDNNVCTIDTCSSAGTCGASCTFTPITQCVSGDGCCPVGCTSLTDNDCPVATKCWNAEYQYLSRNNNQAKKFCKCAQGVYAYKNYSYTFGRKTAYKYNDSGDNTNWLVSSASSSNPIAKVTCTDGISYPTNKDYYFPK
jgi:serine protease